MANDEYNQFDRYNDVRTVDLSLFDHTNDNNATSQQGRAIRLSGNASEKTGLVKILSVMPGDVINMRGVCQSTSIITGVVGLLQ